MAKISNVSAIAWDMDGTIIDSFKVLFAVTAEACKAFGKEMPSTDVFLRNFHGSLSH